LSRRNLLCRIQFQLATRWGASEDLLSLDALSIKDLNNIANKPKYKRHLTDLILSPDQVGE